MKPELVELVMETLAGFQPKVSDAELKEIRAALDRGTLRHFVAAGFAVGYSQGSEAERNGTIPVAEAIIRRGDEAAWAIVSGHEPDDADNISRAASDRTSLGLL